MSTDRTVSMDLIHYRPLKTWTPQVGDVIIKHGWIFKTKWFGVITFINGYVLSVAKDNMMSMLVTSSPLEVREKTEEIPLHRIMGSFGGSFAIVSHDRQHNVTIWYV